MISVLKDAYVETDVKNCKFVENAVRTLNPFALSVSTFRLAAHLARVGPETLLARLGGMAETELRALTISEVVDRASQQLKNARDGVRPKAGGGALSDACERELAVVGDSLCAKLVRAPGDDIAADAKMTAVERFTPYDAIDRVSRAEDPGVSRCEHTWQNELQDTTTSQSVVSVLEWRAVFLNLTSQLGRVSANQWYSCVKRRLRAHAADVGLGGRLLLRVWCRGHDPRHALCRDVALLDRAVGRVVGCLFVLWRS